MEKNNDAMEAFNTAIKNSKRCLARVDWYGKMTEAYKAMPNQEKARLDEWLAKNKGTIDLSEWPGWIHYIGKKPE